MMAKKKEEVKTTAVPKDYKPRLKNKYREQILPEIKEKLGLSSSMSVPKLTKVVINIGVSEAKDNIQILEQAKADLALITGQAPQLRRARKSISNFKLREGMPIGVRVTLRGDRMFEFLDRFISVACPRIRDFRGFRRNCFDGQGNLNLGLKEHSIFPEIDLEKSPRTRGMNITCVTTASDDKSGLVLMEAIGIPFRKLAEQKN